MGLAFAVHVSYKEAYYLLFIKTKMSDHNLRKFEHEIILLCFNYLRPVESIRRDILEPLSGHLKCLYEKYYSELYNYYDESMHTLWEKWIRKCIDFIKVSCPEDTLLFQMAEALETREIERMKLVISNKYNDMKSNVAQCWEKGKCIISSIKISISVFVSLKFLCI